MTHQSEFGQERVALEILSEKRNGVFVDIGATDGHTRNNSWSLETDYGWTGVCVEPVLASYEKLRLRRSCATLHACVGDYAQLGVVRFHEDQGNHEISRINTSAQTVVPCLPLNIILDSLGILDVDFLSIDTEGNEFNILRALDFAKRKFRVITFEHNDHWGPEQKQNKAAIHELLSLNGYLKHADVGVDSIYKRLS